MQQGFATDAPILPRVDSRQHWAPDPAIAGPDESCPLMNGALTIYGYHTRAIILPPGVAMPGPDRPCVMVPLSGGSRLVLASEGPTPSMVRFAGQMRAKGYDLDLAEHEAWQFSYPGDLFRRPTQGGGR